MKIKVPAVVGDKVFYVTHNEVKEGVIQSLAKIIIKSNDTGVIFNINDTTVLAKRIYPDRKSAERALAARLLTAAKADKEIEIPDPRPLVSTLSWQFSTAKIKSITYFPEIVPYFMYGLEGDEFEDIYESVFPDNFPEIKIVGERRFSAIATGVTGYPFIISECSTDYMKEKECIQPYSFGEHY